MLQSIRLRIILIGLLPLLLALTYMGLNLSAELGRAQKLEQLEPEMELASRISALVHEMQKERGASAGYLASGADAFRQRVNTQRSATDARLTELEAALHDTGSHFSEEVERALNDYRQALKRLPGLRQQVDQLSLSVRDELARYTALNAKGLKVIEMAGLQIAQPQLRNHFDAYTAFLQAKERAGIERAVLSATFGKGMFTQGLARDFIQLVTAQEIYLAQFFSKGPEDLVRALQARQGQGAFAEVENYRREVYQAIDALTEGRPFPGFTQDASTWFKTITRKIGQLKQLEDRFNTDIQSRVQTLLDHESTRIWRDALLMLAALILIGGGMVLLSTQLIRPIDRAVRAAGRIAEGDLTVPLDTQSKDELGTLIRALQTMQQGLREVLTDQANQTQELVTMAVQIQGNARHVMDGAERQKAEAEQLATAMNEMSASFQEVAQSTEHTAEAAEEGREQSLQGMQELDKLLNAMSALNEAMNVSAHTITELEQKTQSIATTLSTISGIAEQTNLLALNAAIEAARAGDQGRGFAVVADEVRQLAGRTQEATEEITQVIQALTAEVAEAVAQINHARERSADANAHTDATRQAIETINRAIANITDSMQQVASATTEQSAVAEEINRNVAHIAEQADLNAETSKDNAQASDTLHRIAERLSAYSRHFKLS